LKWLLLIYNHVRNELIMKRMNQFLLWTVVIQLSLCAAGCSSTTEGGLDLSEVNSQVSSSEVVEEKSFGERQLEQLMSDRPDMQGVVPTDHAVYRWVVRSFEKERTGGRIYWVAAQPSSGEKAEHAPSYFGYPAYICITAGLDASPLDKWTMLVFEMFISRTRKAYDYLRNWGSQEELMAIPTRESALSWNLKQLKKQEICFEKLHFRILKKLAMFFTIGSSPKPPRFTTIRNYGIPMTLI
jgi:hypothetical protein